MPAKLRSCEGFGLPVRSPRWRWNQMKKLHFVSLFIRKKASVALMTPIDDIITRYSALVAIAPAISLSIRSGTPR